MSQIEQLSFFYKNGFNILTHEGLYAIEQESRTKQGSLTTPWLTHYYLFQVIFSSSSRRLRETNSNTTDKKE